MKDSTGRQTCSRREAMKTGSMSLLGGSFDFDSYRSINASRGRANYQTLSRSSAAIKPDQIFDVLVIGSGYGGAILAARISEKLKPGKTIAIVERGKEWQPGEFPETSTELFNQTSLGGMNRQRLYELKTFDTFRVLRGIGLGGGSLINANVAIKPEAKVFDKNWPSNLNLETLDPYYRRAASSLRLNQGFSDSNSSPKMDYMEKLGKALSCEQGYRGYRRLNNTAFIPKRNIGKYPGSKKFTQDNGTIVKQAPCIMCGNCMSGCNVGAKNTLASNYLPMAKSNGAEMYTDFEAERIEKDGDYAYRVIGKSYQKGKIIEKTICARRVIVSAGTLGTNEILLKSDNLSLSPMLGKKFNGNGDAIAAVNDTEQRINGFGQGTDKYDAIPKRKEDRAGLSIQSAVDFRGHREAPFMIQDLTLPQGLGPINATSPFSKKQNLLAFLIMSQDTLDGELRLSRSGKLTGSWPFETQQPIVDMLKNQLVDKARKRLVFISRGMFDLQIMGRKLTAHPLGGACLGDEAELGVVDHLGRAFDCNKGGIHKGLYVADGSVIPSSLIANPLLTISAVSERIAEGFVNDPGNQTLF